MLCTIKTVLSVSLELAKSDPAQVVTRINHLQKNVIGRPSVSTFFLVFSPNDFVSNLFARGPITTYIDTKILLK